MTSTSFVMIILLILPIFSWGATSTVATNLNPANLDGLKAQFQTAMKSYSDVASLHYTLAGIKELGVQPPDSFCNEIKKLVEKSNVESIYHATEAARALTNCKLPVEDYRSTLTSTLQSDQSTTADIYYAVRSSVNLGLNIDESSVEKRLNALAKTDDSILSQGYALLTGAQLSQPIAKFYADTINDLVQQADEVDGSTLQYEGGVGATALIFNAFYEVAEKAGVPIKIDPKQLVKFASYFSTKKHVATLRSAYYLTKVFKYLSDNKNSVPVVVTRISPLAVNRQNPSVLVSVSNLLGQPVGEMSVVAESAKRKEDGVIVISKQKLISKSSDSSVYELAFYDAKIPQGFYTIHLTLTPRNEGKFIGLTDNTIEVKVTSEGTIENAELSVADRDNAAQAKTYKLTYPNVQSDKLELDYHQKLVFKFQIKDKQSDEFIRVQQAFLRFTNQKSNKEIVYLAEATAGANSQYKVEVDLTTNANDFRHQSGSYELVLILGDSLLQTAFEWKLNDRIQLSFHEESLPDKDHLSLYVPRKEIIHQFHVDEKRPPTIVSLVFSALTFLPLLILLILWLKLGFNLYGLPLGLSPLGFHISHGAVFALMFFYWKYLDMFQTIRYLALITIPLFLFGQRVLATLAARREKKL
jgi:oligosaccharyltransferase complex subunit delta (ribophorin II)